MGLEYCNPVHDGYFADPFVMRTDDGYVAIGTGRSVDDRVFEVLRSPDLVHWRSVGGALVPPSGSGHGFLGSGGCARRRPLVDVLLGRHR